MLAADYVFGVAVAFVIGCNLYFESRIAGDRIAMQWGPDGKPVWYAPKRVALWGMVAFMLAVRLLIWAAMTYDPARVHGADLGLVAFSVTVAVAHVLLLIKAANSNLSH
jgi:hypothetical protein